jgi:acyl-CoA thioesterase-1
MVGAAALATPKARPLLVLGDSLSSEYGVARGRGWVSLLAQRIAQQGLPYQVINASISGETTAGGHTRLPALLQRHRPAVLILELGGNDALRGLDLKATEAQLRTMAQLAKQSGAQVLLLGMRVPPNYGASYRTAFERMYANLAQTEQLPFVPFFLKRFADNPHYFQADQIHPSESAQTLMLEEVWPTLQTLLLAPTPTNKNALGATKSGR